MMKSLEKTLKINFGFKKGSENRKYKYQILLWKKVCYFEIPFDSIKGFSLQYPEQSWIMGVDLLIVKKLDSEVF